MKTVHLVNAFQRNGGGGITTFYSALLDHARASDEEMVVVAPGESDACHRNGSTKIYEVASAEAALNRKYRMIRPDTWPGVNGRVRAILRREQPDLVDVCDKYSLHYVAGLLRRGWLSGVQRPVLVGTSCERMDENMAHYVSRSKLAQAFCQFYLKWNYFGFFDHHVTVSDHTAGELRDAARGHMRKRGVWIKPMGVSSARFSPSLASEPERHRLRLRLDAGRESVVVVYAGRLAPEKRLPILLDSFAELLRRGERDYRLAIAGDGMLRRPLEEECARRFRGAVTFLGHLGPAELPLVLANADVFLHPNPAEPFGIAPLEAMASGLPLVGCNSGGLLSYANEANAWLTAAEPAALATALGEALVHEATRQRKVDAALATARRFDWPVVAADFRELYRRLVAGASTGETTGAAFESTLGNRFGYEMPSLAAKARAGSG